MAAKIRKGDKVIVLNGRDKGRTSNTSPVRPLSRPLSTMTLSPFRILAAITAPPARAK